MIDGLSGRSALFQSAEIGVHHFGVARQGKDQCDVDVQPGRGRPADGRNACLRGGDLDHQVRPGHTHPQLLGLRHGSIGIVSNEGTDLQAHIPIAAVRLLIQRHECLTGAANIFDRQLPEDLLRVPAGPCQRFQRRVVIGRLGNGRIEDRWVGCHAADIAALDHRRQLAAIQQLALDVVIPERLSELG